MKTGVKEFKREYKHIDIDQIEVSRYRHSHILFTALYLIESNKYLIGSNKELDWPRLTLRIVK